MGSAPPSCCAAPEVLPSTAAAIRIPGHARRERETDVAASVGGFASTPCICCPNSKQIRCVHCKPRIAWDRWGAIAQERRAWLPSLLIEWGRWIDVPVSGSPAPPSPGVAALAFGAHSEMHRHVMALGEAASAGCKGWWQCHHSQLHTCKCLVPICLTAATDAMCCVVQCCGGCPGHDGMWASLRIQHAQTNHKEPSSGMGVQDRQRQGNHQNIWRHISAAASSSMQEASEAHPRSELLV